MYPANGISVVLPQHVRLYESYMKAHGIDIQLEVMSEFKTDDLAYIRGKYVFSDVDLVSKFGNQCEKVFYGKHFYRVLPEFMLTGKWKTAQEGDSVDGIYVGIYKTAGRM